MNKTTLFLLIFIVFSTPKIFSQQKNISFQSINLNIPDPIITKQQFINFNHFMNLARGSFKDKNYEKAFYYLKTAEKDGVHSGDFWFYLGLTVKERGNESASKRYLKKGFEDFGCWECGEAYEKLYEKKLEF